MRSAETAVFARAMAALWQRHSRFCSASPWASLAPGNGDAGMRPEPAGAGQKLTARMKKLSPWEAATVGILKQPWTLTAAAAVVLVRHHSAFVTAVLSFVAFTVLSTATVGLIFLYFARRPGEAQTQLSALQGRLAQAGPAIFAIVCAAVGAFLIADGAIGIAGR